MAKNEILSELKSLVYLQRFSEEQQQLGEPETHGVVEMISDFNHDMGTLSQNMLQIADVMSELQ